MYRDLFLDFEPPLKNLGKLLQDSNLPLYGPNLALYLKCEHAQN
jgi:hypothetical protein